MTGPLDARRTAPTAGTFAWLAAGVAAFTVYGSFVPFEYRPRPWDEAVGAARAAVENARLVNSRSDWVANFLIAVPLGFCLLGALRVDRPGAAAAIGAGLAVGPLCVLFAAAVEFGQLYFPGRTAAVNDVVAQGAGSAAGLAAWVAAGPRLTRWARRVWAGPRVGGTAGRVLVGYLGLLALVQLLPLDLSASPADVYRKVRDRVTVVPFADGSAERAQGWLVLAALYLPVGLLLAAGRSAGVPPASSERRAGGTPAPRRVLGLGLLLAAGLETLQLLVASRVPSTSDVLVGGAAVALGWAVGRGLPATGRGLGPATALLLGAAWAAVLVLVSWPPFDFDGSVVSARLRGLNWVPFAGAYEKDYLSSLEEGLTKVVLFAPLGAVVAGVGSRPARWRWRAVAAAAAGATAAALMEAGQLFLPTRFPGPTDLILGAAGGWVGGVVVLKMRSVQTDGSGVRP